MQLQTQKDKLNFLAELRSTQIDAQNIQNLLEIGKSNFQKSILAKIFEFLSSLDIKISVYYEYTPADDWDDIVNDTNTDDEASKKIKQNIATFCACYKTVRNEIASYDANLVWKMLDKHVVGAKTKHLQFFVFDLLKANIKNMNFVMKNVENNSYLVLLIGLLVRYKFESSVVHKVLAFLLDKCNTWKGTKQLIVLQGCMYICCFKKEHKATVDDFVCKNKEEWHKLNKKIVNMYCSLFGYDKCDIYTCQTEALEYFPFDKPYLDDIYDIYEDDYVVFVK